MDLGQSIRKGTKWLAIGNAGNQVLQFAFGVILARLLVPADFGTILTVQVFTGFVGMFASGGMGQALIRAKEVDESDFTAVFTFQLGVGLLVYLGFFLTAPWFADFFENPIYEDLIRVSALTFLMRPFSYMYLSWLNREMDFKKRSVIGIVSGSLSGVFSVIMAWSGFGVWSLTLSGLAGGLIRSILLAYVTPLTLRLNFDVATMRRHATYGSRIVANDFLGYVRRESMTVILSKLAGPAFLGIFNKADSLFRLPFRVFGGAVAQPVFRAMSKIQDDLDQTKYMFYRVITLLTVYILPIYIGLWWLAGPFIGLVYGEQWLPAVEPLRILAMGGILRIISHPCGVVLMAQNRLIQEMFAKAFMIVFVVCACLVGLNWGLEGVSWGVLGALFVDASIMYFLVYRTVAARVVELCKALAPGLLLNGLLFLCLAAIDFMIWEAKASSPALYLLLMSVSGAIVYIVAFFFLPLPSLASEGVRWRASVDGCLTLVFKLWKKAGARKRVVQ